MLKYSVVDNEKILTKLKSLLILHLAEQNNECFNGILR